jgi:hypothetical protein
MILETSSTYIDGKAGGAGLLLKPMDETRFCRVGRVRIHDEALSQYTTAYKILQRRSTNQ